MTIEAMYLLGYYSRIQTLIEILIHVRVRPETDVLEGLGSDYFDKMTDATRKRWLKSIASVALDRALGSRLESIYSQVATVRNHISHAPLNIGRESEGTDGIRVGSSRWMGKPLPSQEEIDAAQQKLEWLESWLVWLLARQKAVEPFQKREGSWQQFEPDQPPLKPPSA